MGRGRGRAAALNDLPLAGWAALGGGAGAIAGSFVATLVERWPHGRRADGRSACDACGAALRPWELVPVLSFVVLRGRCRRCAAPISRDALAIELACAATGAIALAVAPGIEGAAGAVFAWLLIALAALDLRHFWLPDRLTGALALTGALSAFVAPPPPLARAIGGVVGFGALALIGAAYRRLRGRDGLGAGDAKLFGAIGLWLGWQALPLILVGGSSFGLLIVLAMHLRGETVAADTRLPLGTMLAVAAFPVWAVMR